MNQFIFISNKQIKVLQALSMKMLTILCLIVIAQTLKIPPQTPIIGIYIKSYSETQSYIETSSVKWIQMSGAQVVPIFAFRQTSYIIEQISQINGVFFPGGTMFFSKNNQWTRNAETILEYAKRENDKGNVFPIFGTCLGLELLSFIVSQYNCSVLSQVHDDVGKTHPIHFTEELGYIYQKFSPHLLKKVSSEPGVFFFHHHYAVATDTIQTNEKMKNFWKLTAWSTSSGGQKFVASMQARNYPIYTIQYHPEASVFQWKHFADRSEQAIEAAHIISEAFIKDARKNKNRFKSIKTFQNINIINYPTIIPQNTQYSQIYIINELPITSVE